MALRLFSFFAVLCRLTLASLLGLGAAVLAQSPPPPDGADAGPTAPASHPTPAGTQLFILNISGATLFASNQDITDNGAMIASLPRQTYAVREITPGPHELRFKSFPQGKRVATLQAEAGQTYYLAVGYSPAKSWAFPLGGDPMLIRLVDATQARAMMQEMKPE